MKKSAKLVTLLLVVVMIMAVCLTGCAPKTIDDANKKLADAGYVTAPKVISDVVMVPVNAVLSTQKITAEGVIAAVKSDDKKGDSLVIAMLFSDKDVAKKAGEAIKPKLSEENKKTFRQEGAWIAFGNEAGIKALF